MCLLQNLLEQTGPILTAGVRTAYHSNTGDDCGGVDGGVSGNRPESDMAETPSVQNESASERVSLSESKSSGFRAVDDMVGQCRILSERERCEQGLLTRKTK